jgi:hypothetical protein
MSGRKLLLIGLLLLSCAAGVLLTGCATADDNESEIPWNSPQPWEGSPLIPGLNNR